MDLTQIIYASRPFGFDNATLDGILASARRNNPRHDITGALICRADLYLQLLEGPPAAIASLYAAIEQDDRHTEVRKLIDRPIRSRLFGAWAMRHDPARSWMWTKPEIESGILGRLAEDEIIDVFTRLALEPGER